jgi:hypothetical protein
MRRLVAGKFEFTDGDFINARVAQSDAETVSGVSYVLTEHCGQICPGKNQAPLRPIPESVVCMK